MRFLPSLRWLLVFAVALAAVGAARWRSKGPEGDGGHAPGHLVADSPAADGLGPIGQLGGSTSTVVVRDGRAYVGVGRRMVVLEVHGRSTTEIGQSPSLSDSVRSIALMDDVAWVAAGQAGLVAFDLSLPERPTLLGQLPTRWAAYDVALSEVQGLAYIAEGARGLRIVDISDPRAPAELGRIDTPGEARAVAVESGVAYVADWGTGLRIIDVSDPMAPRHLGELAVAEASDVAVGGERLVVADRARGLLVVDGSDPSAPSLLGERSMRGTVERLALEPGGRRVWVAAREGGLRLFDLSQASAPRELDALQSSTVAWDVALDSSAVGTDAGARRAYVADVGAYTPAQPGIGGAGSWESTHVWGVEAQAPEARGFSGLRVVQSDAGGALEELTVHLSPGFVEGVASVGSANRLLLADGYAGLVMAEATQPGRPTILGSLQTAGAAHAVIVDGPTAYLADGPAGLAAIDLSGGATAAGAAGPMQQLWRVDTPGEALGVAAFAGLLYVADGDGGLRVIDPQTRREVEALPLPGYAWDVDVHDGHAWVSARHGGLRILSLADPRAPTEVVSLLAEDAVVFDLVFGTGNGVAWVAAGPSGLVALDVREPAEPVEMGRLALSGTVVGLSIDEEAGLAYVAAGRGGLAVVDVADPMAMRATRTWALPGVAERVLLHDGIAYVATERGGLQLLRVAHGPDAARARIELPWLSR